MVFSPAVVYLLVSAALFGVAVVVHFHSTTLSLPLSPAISILATLLPILGFLNAYVHPTLLHNAHTSSQRLQQLAPIVLQTLQALVTTVLATLLLEGVVPSPGLECVLENGWSRMYRANDAEGIRRVQDVLDCCGFNSVRDRAFPFSRNSPSTCAETYGRSSACRAPWMGALQSSAAIDFAVVVAVGLMQAIGLLMMREGISWWTAWQTRGWRISRRRESKRPLLEAVPEEDEDGETAERGESTSRGYGAIPNDDDEHEQRVPRVEPSSINNRSVWDA